MDAVFIAIVSYAITISLARLFATKYNYEIDSNQAQWLLLIKSIGGPGEMGCGD